MSSTTRAPLRSDRRRRSCAADGFFGRRCGVLRGACFARGRGVAPGATRPFVVTLRPGAFRVVRPDGASLRSGVRAAGLRAGLRAAGLRAAGAAPALREALPAAGVRCAPDLAAGFFLGCPVDVFGAGFFAAGFLAAGFFAAGFAPDDEPAEPRAVVRCDDDRADAPDDRVEGVARPPREGPPRPRPFAAATALPPSEQFFPVPRYVVGHAAPRSRAARPACPARVRTRHNGDRARTGRAGHRVVRRRCP